jgi:hypothetical protein
MTNQSTSCTRPRAGAAFVRTFAPKAIPAHATSCCKVPFWVFDADQKQTNGTDVRHLSKIVKLPESLTTELWTDANAFDVIFPDGATVHQKAMLVGSAIFLNAIFFERDVTAA